MNTWCHLPLSQTMLNLPLGILTQFLFNSLESKEHMAIFSIKRSVMSLRNLTSQKGCCDRYIVRPRVSSLRLEFEGEFEQLQCNFT